MMRLHVIQTGSVRLKTAWPEGRGHGIVRNLRACLEPTWTQSLPIYAWVIEHPEGVIVIDTGEAAQVSQPGYFPNWPPIFRLAVRETVTPEQEIGPQLRQIGIAPGDVRWLVLTHLHTDHAGGLHHFPRTPIVVARAEYQRATGRKGQLLGYLPQHWPEWFAPTQIDFEDHPIGSFPTSYNLTAAGDVILAPTPGHSAGHLSVLLRDGDQTIAFAGDLSYSQDLMLRQKIDGVSLSEKLAHQSLQRMLTYARSTPTVYLPSHDPDAARRLAEREMCPQESTQE